MYDTQILSRIAEVAEKKTSIPAYPESVQRVLSAVQQSSAYWDIVSQAEEPVPLTAEILNLLRQEGLIQVEEEMFFLTGEGVAFCKENHIRFSGVRACPFCEGRALDIQPYSDTLEAFEEIVKQRPPALQAYDQGFVTPRTTVARVAHMDFRGDLRGKALLILGDDDLVSVAAGISSLPSHICLIEVDSRLTSFVRSVSREYHLKIEVVEQDLRQPLPSFLLGRFDTFEMDPVESRKGFELFLQRGLGGLKGPRKAGYFGLTRLESSLDKWWDFQQVLLKNRAVITDIYPGFNQYALWDYHSQTRAARLAPVPQMPKNIWYTSYWFRIETLKGFQPTNVPFTEPKEVLYADEESSTT